MSEHILIAAFNKMKLCSSHVKDTLIDDIGEYETKKSVDEGHCESHAICADLECRGCLKRHSDQGDAEAVDPEAINTDFTIPWKTENCPYLYNNHDYTILPDIPNRFKDMKTEILMNSLFFSCFCEKWYNGTRRLILQAADLVPRIGRCFQDWDVPYLMVFLRANNDVVSLNLAYNNIHCAGFINLVDYIIAYKHILELNVQNNNIHGPGINHLYQDCEKLPLRSLRLNGNKFGVESAKKVALSLLRNPHLRYLDVAEVDQTASSLVYFTTVMRWDQEESNRTLKVLDLSRPNPGYMYMFDSTHFASVVGCMLRFNRCLVELHLQKYNFSCHDIEIMLEDLKYNDTLHLLDLSNNNIGDHGMEHLADWLRTRPSLTGLILAHNIVTSHGARALSFGMPFSRIRMLDLSYNRISDTGATDILNSIKKSTLLRYLRMFGNCLGDCTAKIVERMLLSGVLVQENIDLKPYRVDHKWYIARYPSDHYKQRYYNVPRYAFPQPLTIAYVKNTMCGKSAPKVNFKYVNPVPVEDRRHWIDKNHPLDCVCCECREDEIMDSLVPSTADIVTEACVCGVCTNEETELIKPSRFQSDVTLFPKPLCLCKPDDCVCCYCLPCKGKNENLSLSEHGKHPINCDCCKCGAQDVEYASSSISTKSNELNDYPDGIDRLQKIALILERVDTEMQQQILKWVNINEATLDSDLTMLDTMKAVCDVQSPALVPPQVPISEPVCFKNCEDTFYDEQKSSSKSACYNSVVTSSSVTNAFDREFCESPEYGTIASEPVCPNAVR